MPSSISTCLMKKSEGVERKKRAGKNCIPKTSQMYRKTWNLDIQESQWTHMRLIQRGPHKLTS